MESSWLACTLGSPWKYGSCALCHGWLWNISRFLSTFSDDVEEKAMAKDLHPKLLAGMFFFFALGATGGITALLTSDKPIFESVTGLTGLALLTLLATLPALFENNPDLRKVHGTRKKRRRKVHGILGSGIMTLFLVHAALGFQLGLSF